MKDQYNEFREQLGKILAAKRAEQCLTQKEIAQRLYIDRSAVSKIEHGDYMLPLFRFIDYCKAVEFPPAEILEILEQIFSFPSARDKKA